MTYVVDVEGSPQHVSDLCEGIRYALGRLGTAVEFEISTLVPDNGGAIIHKMRVVPSVWGIPVDGLTVYMQRGPQCFSVLSPGLLDEVRVYQAGKQWDDNHIVSLSPEEMIQQITELFAAVCAGRASERAFAASAVPAVPVIPAFAPVIPAFAPARDMLVPGPGASPALATRLGFSSMVIEIGGESYTDGCWEVGTTQTVVLKRVGHPLQCIKKSEAWLDEEWRNLSIRVFLRTHGAL